MVMMVPGQRMPPCQSDTIEGYQIAQWLSLGFPLTSDSLNKNSKDEILSTKEVRFYPLSFNVNE